MMRLTVLFKDRNFMVIDKPADMPSVSLEESDESSLARWIVKHFPKQASLKRGKLEAGLIHRLDNDTSGVIVAASTQEAFENLRRQFDEGNVKKEYLALVLGSLPSEGFIDSPIAHHPKSKKKMMTCGSLKEAAQFKARPARTEYKLKEKFEFAGKKYSLVSVTIRTGVRHQIRVHFASIGHPLAGDRLYQNPRMRTLDTLKLNRHFLHAKKISFKDPSSGKIVTFKSPLPAELGLALEKFQ